MHDAGDADGVGRASSSAVYPARCMPAAGNADRVGRASNAVDRRQARGDARARAAGSGIP